MSLKPSVVERKLALTLAASSLVSVGLVTVRILESGSVRYWFLIWNLLLAWPPMLASWLLVRRLRGGIPWAAPASVVLTGVWLAFLPNSFYIVSDLVHLRATGEVSLLYDIVLMMSFTWNGFLLGYLSLYPLHQQLRRRLGGRAAYGVVALTLALCSYAIYLGRYLRWNSWDVITNPISLLFDITNPLISPASHPQAYTTTLMFWVLLLAIYAVIYELTTILRQMPPEK